VQLRHGLQDHRHGTVIVCVWYVIKLLNFSAATEFEV